MNGWKLPSITKWDHSLKSNRNTLLIVSIDNKIVVILRFVVCYTLSMGRGLYLYLQVNVAHIQETAIILVWHRCACRNNLPWQKLSAFVVTSLHDERHRRLPNNQAWYFAAIAWISYFDFSWSVCDISMLKISWLAYITSKPRICIFHHSLRASWLSLDCRHIPNIPKTFFYVLIV